MSNLVVLGFEDEESADAFLAKLEGMEEQDIVHVEDLVKVAIDSEGGARVDHFDSLVRGGAVVGGFLGAIVGILFLAPVAGAAIGAAGGAAAGALSGDYGIEEGFIRQTSEALEPGSAAVFLLVKSSAPDRVEAELTDVEATVISTTLTGAARAQLKDALTKKE